MPGQGNPSYVITLSFNLHVLTLCKNLNFKVFLICSLYLSYHIFVIWYFTVHFQRTPEKEKAEDLKSKFQVRNRNQSNYIYCHHYNNEQFKYTCDNLQMHQTRYPTSIYFFHYVDILSLIKYCNFTVSLFDIRHF